MCPDRDLISAYVDGEVPSPWRERLEEHLASCADCASVAAGYERLGASLRGAAPSAAEESAALERGRARLDALLASAEPRRRPLRSGGSTPGESWRRSVSLPLPLAAAAAVLVILLGGATTMLALRQSRGAGAQAVASGEIIPRQAAQAQPASMDEILRYLDSSNGQVTLTINLPASAALDTRGAPVIMREGQVLQGRTVGDRAP